MKVAQVLRLTVVLVAAHSLVLGTAMLLFPRWALRLSGWEYDGPVFFPSQSGIFLLILAGAYIAGTWHRPFAWLLVCSKAAAVAFLAISALVQPLPPAILLATVLDGLMGAGVGGLLWAEGRSRRAVAPGSNRKRSAEAESLLSAQL